MGLDGVGIDSPKELPESNGKLKWVAGSEDVERHPCTA
jgi:hypothetical protein